MGYRWAGGGDLLYARYIRTQFSVLNEDVSFGVGELEKSGAHRVEAGEDLRAVVVD